MRSRPTPLSIVLALSWLFLGMNVAALGDDQPLHRHTGSLSTQAIPGGRRSDSKAIGRPVVIVVEAGARPDPADYVITAFSKGKEGASYPVRFPTAPPYSTRVTLEREADELVFSRDRTPPDKPVELARQPIRFADCEAESIARPDEIINPVDLGTILVPSGWLLLGLGQSATLTTAAISRNQDWASARLTGSDSSRRPPRRPPLRCRCTRATARCSS